MKQGHIKLARKIFQSEEWEEPRTFSRFEAWVDLIQLAAWRAMAYSTRQHGRDELARGEFVASVRFLGERWGWSKSAVQRYLDAAQKAGRLTGQRAGHHGAIYLIANYDAYQGAGLTSGTPDAPENGTVAGQSRDSERDKVRSSKSSKAVKEVEPWVFEGLTFWRAKVGRISPTRFRAALLDLVTERGWPEVRAGIEEYIAAKNGKSLRLEWFAEEGVRWIEESKQDIVDPVTRWFTPKGQRWYDSQPTG